MEWSYSDITRHQHLAHPVIKDGVLYGLQFGNRNRFNKYFRVSCFNGGYRLFDIYAGAGSVDYFEFMPKIKVDSSFRIEIELE